LKKLGFVLAGITAMPIGGQASETPCGSTIMMPTGVGDRSFSALGAGVCVLAADKLFSNFGFGNLPTTNGTVTFDLEDPENYNITFTDSFVAGHIVHRLWL
jgi:hypothetical protein